MARPKKYDVDVGLDKRIIKNMAGLAFQFDEIAFVLNVKSKQLKPYEHFIMSNWPDDKNFIKIRRKRLAKLGLITPQNKINTKLRMRIKGQIGEMICREMGSVEALIGYSLEALQAHIENLFLPGMSWDNTKDWHIDHIKPRSKFKVKDIKECFRLDNLRPLWAKDNLKKGSSHG